MHSCLGPSMSNVYINFLNFSFDMFIEIKYALLLFIFRAKRNVDESLTILLETMSQRKDRYGNPVGKLGLKDLRK